MNFINSIANTSNFAFFLRNFDEFFSGFRAKFQKIVTCVAFSIKFAKTNQKFAENSEFCEKNHYYSKLFTSLLSHTCDVPRSRTASVRSLQTSCFSCIAQFGACTWCLLASGRVGFSDGEEHFQI